MKVVIAGSSGFIGTALVESFRADGHDVTRLVRRAARGRDEVPWDPQAGTIDMDALAAADVVVNLAGVSIGERRLTSSRARLVLQSRLDATGVIARGLAEVGTARLVQGSAIGFYGPTGESTAAEDAPAGSGVMADITSRWEAATRPAVEAGVPVAWARTGLVLAPDGALASRIKPAVRWGHVRAFGNGKQWHSWISLRDAVRGFRLLAEPTHTGPFNLVAPGPTRDRDFFAALARAAGVRPLFPIPGFAMRIAVGPAAGELLDSQAIVPHALAGLGFTWQDAMIEDAARWVMRGDGPPPRATPPHATT